MITIKGVSYQLAVRRCVGCGLSYRVVVSRNFPLRDCGACHGSSFV
jgi:hypothetical protein